MAEISKSIEQLEKEVLDKNNEISRLKSLQEKFPDLESYTNRWKKVRYTSKLVNNIVTDCEIYHGCGCCNDSPLKISPFHFNSDSAFFTFLTLNPLRKSIIDRSLIVLSK